MSVGGRDLVRMRVYRDGTLIRLGAGGAPTVAVGAMSYWPGNGIFDKLMEKMPPQLLVRDIDYVEEVNGQAVVFELKFHGVSLNGLVGEQAKWGEERVIRFTLDIHTQQRSPVLALVDSLIKDAMGHSNSWYFDVVILAAFGRRSKSLPKQTFVLKEEGEDLKHELGNFLSQMLKSPRKWNFMAFPEGKVYVDEDGSQHKLIFKIEDGKFNYGWSDA